MAAALHQVITLGLLFMLGLVLVIGGGLAFFIVRWRRRRAANEPVQPQNQFVLSLPVLHRAVVRRPNCWLAIRNRNVLAVQEALSLHNPQPCSWSEGLSANAEQKLFVSPPVSGWILVTGSALPEPADDVDACFRFLMDLSRKIGHVQFFTVNSVLNHHAWAQVDTGRIVRAYAWAEKTLWNQGAVTQPEIDLGMKCIAYAEALETLPFASADTGLGNTDKVRFLAARWSIDPEDIDERFIEQGWGVVGEPSRHF